MAVPVWPVELPQKVQQQGYTRVYANGVQATDMEAGPPKTRLKSSSMPENVEGTIVVDRSGLARFRRFFQEETSFGAKPFWIADQVLDGAPLSTEDGDPLLTPDGEPLIISARWLVMFKPGSPPREGENRGAYFNIAFSLLVLP